MKKFNININLFCDENNMSSSWQENHLTVNADNIKSEITSSFEDLGFTIEFDNAMEDAMILWEAVLNDLPRFEPYQNAHGTAQLRCKMVEFIPYILRDWEENKDMHDTYDWDYLPYWIANFLEVTDSNIEYRRKQGE